MAVCKLDMNATFQAVQLSPRFGVISSLSRSVSCELWWGSSVFHSGVGCGLPQMTALVGCWESTEAMVRTAGRDERRAKLSSGALTCFSEVGEKGCRQGSVGGKEGLLRPEDLPVPSPCWGRGSG